MNTFLRRITKYAATAAGMSAAGRWAKKKTGTSVADDPNPGSAQWPPLPGLSDDDISKLEKTSLEDRVQTSVSSPKEPASGGSWIKPYESGACPLSHPVKVAADSETYRTEDSENYERTRAERCYPNAVAAEADGFRAATD